MNLTDNIYIELNQLGLIQISGNDAARFLQGQLTCDVNEVSAEHHRLGAVCDPKGRIQATFRLLSYEDNFYFLLPQSMIEHLLTYLKKYAVFFKVNLQEVTTNWLIFGLNGENTINALALASASITPATTTEQTVKLNNGLLLSITDKQPRFILLLKKDETKQLAVNLKNQLATSNQNAWDLLDIIAGIPTIYPETLGEFTPHQIGYQLINGISFKKGCYTGQEIIARMHYLGKLKQQLYRISFDNVNTIHPGTKLYNANQQEIGTVINAAQDAPSHYQALAVLQNTAVSESIHLANHPQAVLVHS